MFNIEFSSQSKRFLKNAEILVAKRLIEKTENLAVEPFPSDVKYTFN